MRAVLLTGFLVALATVACGPSPAYEPEAPEAQAGPATPPPPPSAPPPGAIPGDPPELGPDAAPPPPDQWTVEHPTGHWVYANGDGWMWIPNEPNQVVVEETPYVYLYTPAYGWTWYVSPWGRGPYRYGVWVVHPWRPVGWRYGWVARPPVIVHLHGHPHVVHGPRPPHGRRH